MGPGDCVAGPKSLYTSNTIPDCIIHRYLWGYGSGFIVGKVISSWKPKCHIQTKWPEPHETVFVRAYNTGHGRKLSENARVKCGGIISIPNNSLLAFSPGDTRSCHRSDLQARISPKVEKKYTFCFLLLFRKFVLHFLTKMCIVFPEMFSKTLYFDRFSCIFRRTRFSAEQDFSRKIWLHQFEPIIILKLHAEFQKDPMTEKNTRQMNGLTDERTDGEIDMGQSINRTNLLCRWVQTVL